LAKRPPAQRHTAAAPQVAQVAVGQQQSSAEVQAVPVAPAQQLPSKQAPLQQPEPQAAQSLPLGMQANTHDPAPLQLLPQPPLQETPAASAS
jgi:hypothetical protein